MVVGSDAHFFLFLSLAIVADSTICIQNTEAWKALLKHVQEALPTSGVYREFLKPPKERCPYTIPFSVIPDGYQVEAAFQRVPTLGSLVTGTAFERKADCSFLSRSCVGDGN